MEDNGETIERSDLITIIIKIIMEETWRTMRDSEKPESTWEDNEKNMRSRRKPGSTLGDNEEIMRDI